MNGLSLTTIVGIFGAVVGGALGIYFSSYTDVVWLSYIIRLSLAALFGSLFSFLGWYLNKEGLLVNRINPLSLDTNSLLLIQTSFLKLYTNFSDRNRFCLVFLIKLRRRQIANAGMNSSFIIKMNEFSDGFISFAVRFKVVASQAFILQ